MDQIDQTSPQYWFRFIIHCRLKIRYREANNQKSGNWESARLRQCHTTSTCQSWEPRIPHWLNHWFGWRWSKLSASMVKFGKSRKKELILVEFCATTWLNKNQKGRIVNVDKILYYIYICVYVCLLKNKIKGSLAWDSHGDLKCFVFGSTRRERIAAGEDKISEIRWGPNEGEGDMRRVRWRSGEMRRSKWGSADERGSIRRGVPKRIGSVMAREHKMCFGWLGSVRNPWPRTSNVEPPGHGFYPNLCRNNL